MNRTFLAVLASLAALPLQAQVTITPSGPAELVFDLEVHATHLLPDFWQSGPDLPVSAFKGPDGDVQLVLAIHGATGASGGIRGGNLRMKGPDFDSLSVCPPSGCPTCATNPDDCFVMTSDTSGRVDRHNDEEWVASTWYEPSTGWVHALVHMEYASYLHLPSEFSGSYPYCPGPDNCCNGLDVALGICGPGQSPSWPYGCGGGDGDLFCQNTTITQAISLDGGEHYVQPDDLGQGPPEVVFHGPYTYQPMSTDWGLDANGDYELLNPEARTPYGNFLEPSNLFQTPWDPSGYYVLVKQALPPIFAHRVENAPDSVIPPAEKAATAVWADVPNVVLARSDNLRDATTWRLWDGETTYQDPVTLEDYPVPTRSVIDPYVVGEPGANDSPLQHVGYPLDAGWQQPGATIKASFMSDNVTWNRCLERFVLLATGQIPGEPGTIGVIYSTSTNLIDWTPYQHIDDPALKFNPGDWMPIYPTIIDHGIADDPVDPRVNFDQADDTAYLYYRLAEPFDDPDPSIPAWAEKNTLYRVPVTFGCPE